MNGEGDRLFYGHSNAAQTGFDLWWLIDHRAFRAGLIRHSDNGFPIRCGDKANGDGTWFKWFDIRSFPSEQPLVMAASGREFQYPDRRCGNLAAAVCLARSR